MSFTVDSRLLEEPFHVDRFGVSVRPPAGWEALPADRLAAATSRPANDTHLLAVFMRSAGPSVLMVSDAPDVDADAYLGNLREQFGEVQDGHFRVNSLTVRQYLMRPQGQVNFRLLIATSTPANRTHRRLQLDYIVPQSAWSSQVRAVESSIGSLQVLGAPVGAPQRGRLE